MHMTDKIIIMKILLRLHPMLLEWKNINVFELTMFIIVVFMFNVFELVIFIAFEMEEYWYLIFILIELLIFDYVWNGRKKILMFDNSKYRFNLIIFQEKK